MRNTALEQEEPVNGEKMNKMNITYSQLNKRTKSCYLKFKSTGYLPYQSVDLAALFTLSLSLSTLVDAVENAGE